MMMLFANQFAQVLVLAALLLDVAVSQQNDAPQRQILLQPKSRNRSFKREDCEVLISHSELTLGSMMQVKDIVAGLGADCAKAGYGDEPVTIVNGFELPRLADRPDRRQLQQLMEEQVPRERQLASKDCDDFCSGCMGEAECLACCWSMGPYSDSDNSDCTHCQPIKCSTCTNPFGRRLDDGGFKDSMEEGRRRLQQNEQKASAIAAQCTGDYKHVAKTLQMELGNMCLGDWSNVEVLAEVTEV